MLLNLREILEPAVKDNFAVGGFNVTESTMFKAIVEEAQERSKQEVTGKLKGRCLCKD